MFRCYARVVMFSILNACHHLNLQAGASTVAFGAEMREKFAHSLRVPAALGGQLKAYDFAPLWKEKHQTHLMGTREWAFTAVEGWLKNPKASKLFWLTGGGGTGKSVLCAELLRRLQVSGHLAAWHFAATMTRVLRSQLRSCVALPPYFVGNCQVLRTTYRNQCEKT